MIGCSYIVFCSSCCYSLFISISTDLTTWSLLFLGLIFAINYSVLCLVGLVYDVYPLQLFFSQELFNHCLNCCACSANLAASSKIWFLAFVCLLFWCLSSFEMFLLEWAYSAFVHSRCCIMKSMWAVWFDVCPCWRCPSMILLTLLFLSLVVKTEGDCRGCSDLVFHHCYRFSDGSCFVVGHGYCSCILFALFCLFWHGFAALAWMILRF